MRTRKSIKATPLKVTFETDHDADVVALAKLGIGDKYIVAQTGLSPSQVSYRLNKAKKLEGHEDGYRVQWRTGSSDVLRHVLMDMRAALRLDVKRNLPGKLHHPTPEVVK